MIKNYFFVVIAFLCFVFNGFGQVNIIPTRTDVSGFPTWADTDVTGTTYIQLLKATSSTITPAMDFDSFTSETLDFKARTFGGTNVAENTVTVSISTDNGANWTVLGTRNPGSTTLVAQTQFDLSSYSGSQVKVKFSVAGTDNGIGAGIDDIAIKGVVITGPSHNVTFNANGGTGTMADQSIGEGTSANLTSNSFTRAGYAFDGWATTSGGAVVYANNASYTMGTTDVTLYAHWSVYVAPCGSESFTNSALTTSYANGSFAGDNGVTWSYTESRDVDTYGINGKGIMLRRASDNSKISSSSVAGGIGDFTCKLKKAFTGAGNRQVELFVNGVSKGTSIAWDNTTVQTFTVSGINIEGNVIVEIRNITANQVTVDDIEWSCYVPCTDTVDWSILQFPNTTQTITVGATFPVFTRAYDPIVTQPAGSDPNLKVWIGYSSTNNSPSLTGWTWIPATFNQQYGNDDEYQANLGLGLAPGTYYYASRFQIGNCIYTYGGSSGVWNNDSVQLIVQPDQVDFCNLQSPATGLISTGKPYSVFARVYEPGVTESAGANAKIKAWIGYSTSNTDPSTWPAGNWVVAAYQGQFGNDDEYVGNIGPSLTIPGTYYYASRFQLNGSTFSYGGISPPSGGNFWDGTNYISGVVTVTAAPDRPTGFRACMEDTIASLSWNAPLAGSTPDGYVVFAIEGGTNISGTKLDAIQYTADSNFATALLETPATLGKVVYKGIGTSAIVTGLTENTNYTFAVFAYKNESSTGWSTLDAGSRQTNMLAQGDVRNVTATPATNKVTLNWALPTPTACWDELIIVANQGPVVFTPTGSYAPVTGNYTTPNTVVYATIGTPPSSRAIAGLINDLNYCFKIYIRRGSNWSDGVEICATPTLTYCASSGNTSFATGIESVNFNTINNTGTSTTNDYTNYTAISTTLTLGEIYDLSVNVNVDGKNTVYTKAWIDWNMNGSFNDSGEEYDLGTIYNPSATVDLLGASSESPLSIEVPTGASIGNTRMRISSKWADYSTSCETGFSGEVEDYTINIQRPTGPEINVKGLAISIPSGFDSPYGLNNTLFPTTNILATSTPKTYTVQNIGLSTLILTGTPNPVILTGDHPGDFIISTQPSTSITSGGNTDIIIRFKPTADGVRTAIVSIQNNDTTGGENPYTFKIQGTGNCVSSIPSNILPNSGPVGTEVLITSSSNLTGASATLNGLLMTTISSSASELIVQVPAGASSGILKVIFNNGCSSNNTFNLIETAINGCQAASASSIPSDLFISEVTDATTGSSSYVEIFNGTGASINLNNYSIKIYNNGATSATTTLALTGTINSGGTHVITIGTTDCDPNNLGAGVVKQTFDGAGGINFKNDSSDLIALYKISSASIIDALGVYGSKNWANSLGIGKDGVNFKRKNTASPLPSAAFDLADWDMIDWTDCSDSDYGNLGVYDFSVGIPPSVTLQPIAPISTCDLSAVLTVEGMEGYNPPTGDTAELNYQWFYNEPGTNVWVEILSSNSSYSGQQTEELTIPNAINLDNYQYYCQVRESTVTCFAASNAVKLHVFKSTWNGTAWLPSAPTINSIAIIDGDYNTSVGGVQTSFSACQLIVNPGRTLTISANKYVEVQNNVFVNGEIIVSHTGSFVQINDAGTVTGTVLTDPTLIKVEKETGILNKWYEYTYWSSPVANETIGVALADANPSRRFWFNAQNFLDAFQETGNNNVLVPGHDDIDDDGNDWTLAPAGMVMLPGVGYAATHRNIGFIAGLHYKYTFKGAFNNGIYTVPIYRNDVEMADNNWNFIGNPYPSAISADSFLAANTLFNLNGPGGPMTGAIFLWSQNTDASDTGNGNENQNFAQSDYAIINGSGETAGGDGIIPTRFIPSGQGIFVAMANAAPSNLVSGTVRTANVTFNNSMRVKDNNSLFFRASENGMVANKLRLNLTSNNGVFNQILVAYVEGATDGNDGMYYDAPKNLSTDANSIIYTLIDNDETDLKLAIQGKYPNSLGLDEVIGLGFYTSINEPTNFTLSIADVEGEFLTSNTVYLKDNLMNITFNLSAGDYLFSSVKGEFNDRFQIIFREQPLSVIENEIPASGISIIELTDGRVKFSVGNNLEIKAVEIIDMLGRTLYRLKGTSASEVYELSNLSQAAYMAKVTLSNGQVITKRAVKQK